VLTHKPEANHPTGVTVEWLKQILPSTPRIIWGFCIAPKEKKNEKGSDLCKSEYR